MQKRITKILAAAEPNGNVKVVRQLVQEAKKVGANAIALLGSLSPRGSDPRKYGQVLKELSEARTLPFMFPVQKMLLYLSCCEMRPASKWYIQTFTVFMRRLRWLRGNFWFGIGGLIEDDPKTTRDELVALRYPGWELEYRLKFLRELKNYRKMFLFTTPPKHGHLDEKGSAAVTEIIKTCNPAIVLVGGRGQKYELLGTSRVIACGSLAEGTFKVVDLVKQEVVSGTLHQPATAA